MAVLRSAMTAHHGAHQSRHASTDRRASPSATEVKVYVGPMLSRVLQGSHRPDGAVLPRSFGRWTKRRAGRAAHGAGARLLCRLRSPTAARPGAVVVIQAVWPGVVPGPVRRPGLPGSAAASPVTAMRRIVQPPGTRARVLCSPSSPGLSGLRPGAGWPPGTRAHLRGGGPYPAACPAPGRQGPVHAIASPSWLAGQGPGASAGSWLTAAASAVACPAPALRMSPGAKRPAQPGLRSAAPADAARQG